MFKEGKKWSMTLASENTLPLTENLAHLAI